MNSLYFALLTLFFCSKSLLSNSIIIIEYLLVLRHNSQLQFSSQLIFLDSEWFITSLLKLFLTIS